MNGKKADKVLHILGVTIARQVLPEEFSEKRTKDEV